MQRLMLPLAMRSLHAGSSSSSNTASASWLSFMASSPASLTSTRSSSSSVPPPAPGQPGPPQTDAQGGQLPQPGETERSGEARISHASDGNAPNTAEKTPFSAPTASKGPLVTKPGPAYGRQPKENEEDPANPTKGKEQWYSSTSLMMDPRGAGTPLKSSEYASSHDDIFGVQKNWFTSLYKQLNYFAKTGAVPNLKGRQKQVFESVEKEFEVLYRRHVVGSGQTGMEHRATLMMCLAIATHRILTDEIADPALVRDVIRTNQGSMMMALLLPLHRFRIWILRYFLAEDPYKQAVAFLPALQSDMGALCQTEIRKGPWREDASGGASPDQEVNQIPGSLGSGSRAAVTGLEGVDEVSLVVVRCKYHEILTSEDTPALLSEFCCSHGMTWLNQFKSHGVEVGLERCMAWEDGCCSLRVAKGGPCSSSSK